MAYVLSTPSGDGAVERDQLRVVESPRLRAHWLVFPAGDAVERHAHAASDEVFVVASGHATFEFDGAEVAVGPGDTLALEPGEFHSIAVGGEPLVLLAVVAPNTHDYVR
jgi:mannose-6-phosphate isomerase-like protein (cupin superfamily)